MSNLPNTKISRAIHIMIIHTEGMRIVDRVMAFDYARAHQKAEEKIIELEAAGHHVEELFYNDASAFGITNLPQIVEVMKETEQIIEDCITPRHRRPKVYLDGRRVG